MRPLLPIVSTSAARGHHLPLADQARSRDRNVRPVYAVWELTLRCDLACRHCGSRAGRARPDELSLAEAVALVDELAELGVQEVTLIGGEAYLYPGWLEVVRAIVDHGMTCTMTTGGVGITTELAQQAKAAGLRGISISIDGNVDTHDTLRGRNGAYAAALAAARFAGDASLAVGFNTQVNRLNLNELEHIFNVVRQHKAHGWQVFLTVPMGRASDEPHLLLQPKDLLVLLPNLSDLHARASSSGIRLLPGNNIGYFGPYEKQLREALRCPTQSSCSAGRAVLGIEANGDIKGCPSLPSKDWVGGNVRQRRLLDIWERSEKLRYTRDMTVETHLWGFCKSCYYAKACMGGCTWTATSLFGKPGNNPYCHHRVLDFEARGLQERIVPIEKAPGEAFDCGLWGIVEEPLSS